jgi:hypothetical protein
MRRISVNHEGVFIGWWRTKFDFFLGNFQIFRALMVKNDYFFNLNNQIYIQTDQLGGDTSLLPAIASGTR